jgi:hypothetical protein
VSHFHRLLFIGLIGIAACGKGGPNLSDAGGTDARQFDAQVPDTTPPDTTITAQPAALTNNANAHFEFTSTEDGSTFACAIDGGTPAPCTSPFESTVAEGAHTFSVAATDRAGNVDPTPATAAWTVDLTPPDTTITKNPPAVDNSVNVEFDFTATEVGSTFECMVDAGAWTACTSPDLLTALTDGSHTFSVRATDPAGNVDATPATYTWTIDTSTPDTVIDSGPTGSVQATTATFTFHSPNAGAGATFKCALDAAAPATCASPITYNGLAEATHTFSVAVTNAAGTSDPTPATQTWTVDHTAPTVTITGGPNGPTNDTTPSFPFTTAGNPTLIECAVDSGAYAACTSPFTTAALADGPHTVHVRATDAAGNQGSDSRSFTVDTVGPTVTITSGPAALTKLTTATFAFTASESPVTYACSLDAAPFAACASGVTYTALADGVHTFAVRATDVAGNTGAAATATWTVDTQPPTVTIDAPTPSSPTNATTATFVFHSPDASATFTCALDGGAFASCATGQQYTGLTGGAGTPHTFQVKATDAAGNTGAPASFTWTVDTQAPTIAIDPPTPANPTNATSATFTFHSPSDANATYQCHMDTSSYAACAPGVSYASLTGGAGTAHSFHVRAIDAAGNVGAGTSFAWTIDTQAPTVVIDTTPANPTNATSATFTFHSADGGTSFACSIDGGAFTSCASGKAYAGLTGGAGASHTFQVEATDDAGNTGGPATFTWTIDTQAPTVSIDPPKPGNPTKTTTATFTFHSADGGTSFLCSIDGGTFSACTSTTTYTNLSGANQTGTSHTFQVKATDDAGNTGAASSFTWTVDTTPPVTTIASTPPNPSASGAASFTFSANETSTFTCQLDSNAAAACNSGSVSYSGLTNATHTFTVYATDTALNDDPTPATYTWVVNSGPPTITQVPPAGWTVNYFPFAFTGPVANPSSYQCSTDGGITFSTCTSPKTVTGATYGAANTLTVRWIDAAGNASASATATWTPVQGLVLYYPFDNNLKNQSILAGYYNHDGTGPVSFGGGYAGGALSPLGPVTLNNTIQPLTSASAYTISFWTDAYMWPNAKDGYAQGPMLSTIDPAQKLGGCSISNGDRAVFTVTCDGNPGGLINAINATITSVGIWQNVTLRYAGPGANVQVYLNGNLRGTIANANAAEVFSQFQLRNMVVGGTPTDANTPLIPIDDLRVYNTAYSDQVQCTDVIGGIWSAANGVCMPVLPGVDVAFEFGALLNYGAWADLVSSVAGTFTFQAGKVGNGVYANYNSANLPVPISVAGDANFVAAPAHTVTLWFYDLGDGDQYVFTEGTDFVIRAEAHAGTLTVFARASDGEQITKTAAYTTKAWHQLMLVDQGAKTTELDVYLDGSLATILKFVNTVQLWQNFQLTTGEALIDPITKTGISDVVVDEIKVWPYDLVNMTNAKGQQEALCLLGFGGGFNETTGNCTFP